MLHSFLTALFLTGSPSVVANTPNFVVIMADDLGYGDLGCYGGWIRTPHIDALAAGGVRFTDYHSNGAVCSPTRAALLTGRYQQRAGIPGVIYAAANRPEHQHGMQPRENTSAELLETAGYKTAIFGKWHLGYMKKYNPIHHGFDRFRGYVSGNVDFFSHVDQAGNYDWWDGDETIEEEGYVTHLITKHAVRFIEDNRGHPFCLYLAHEAPHYPYQGPNDKAERTVGGRFKNHGSRPDKKEAYREMVVELDESVGAVVATLRELNLEQKTLIFFVSDNGATSLGSNGRLRGRKGQIWEGGHRVPGIANWPGRIKPGTTTRETIMSMDIMPTMLALAGVEPPHDRPLDGVNLSPALFERVPLATRHLFWQHGDQLAMREGRWKLVRPRAANLKNSLFDLTADLADTKDLAAVHVDRVTRMSVSLERWRADMAEDATQQPDK